MLSIEREAIEAAAQAQQTAKGDGTLTEHALLRNIAFATRWTRTCLKALPFILQAPQTLSQASAPGVFRILLNLSPVDDLTRTRAGRNRN